MGAHDKKDSLNRMIGTIFYIGFFGIAGLIGLWAMACLLRALFKRGPLRLLKDYISAVSGKTDSH